MKFINIVLLFILIPIITFSQSNWYSQITYHSADIFIDADGRAANCLNGKEQEIRTALKTLQSQCGLTLNIVFLTRDCPGVLANEYSPDNHIGVGESMTLDNDPNNPQSNVWWVEGVTDLIIIRPYQAEFIGIYGYELIAGGLNVEDNRGTFLLQHELEDDFAKAMVNYSTKYSCLIFEFIKSYAEHHGVSNCSSGFPLHQECDNNELNKVNAIPPYEYTSGGYVVSSIPTLGGDLNLGTTYSNHFSSSFCTNLQILVPYPISSYTKEIPNYRAELKEKNQKNDFLLLMYDGQGKFDLDVEKGTTYATSPLEDVCYPLSRRLTSADLSAIKNYANSSATNKSGFTGDTPLFRGLNMTHSYLTATESPAPGNNECFEPASSNSPQLQKPKFYFKNDQVVSPGQLKNRFTGNAINPNNTTVKQSGSLYDYTGGLAQGTAEKFVKATTHVDAVSQGTMKLEVITSVSKSGGYNSLGSFNAALQKFRADSASLTGKNSILFLNYDQITGEMSFTFAFGPDYYNCPLSLSPGDKKVLKDGMDDINKELIKACLEQEASAYQNVIGEDVENSDKLTGGQSKNVNNMGLWEGVSPINIGFEGMVADGVVIVGETVWNLQFPERIWNPEKKGDTYFQAPGGLIGIGDGLLDQIDGKVVNLLGLAQTGKDFVSSPESRKQILTAFRYPHIIMLAQYANSLNDLLTSDNPEVRWYSGGYLGTKIIFDLTSGTFLTGIKTDLKNLGSDAEKLTKAFKGDWSSAFNQSARLGIQETPPTSGGSDPHKLSPPPHERTQNTLTGKLDETNQLKLTDKSGVIKEILNQIIDKNNGDYLGGLNEDILKSFIEKLPDPSTPSGKNIFFEIKTALSVDVPGTSPVERKVDPVRAENFIKDLHGNTEFAELIGSDKAYVKGWSLFFDQPGARKNPDILKAFKEWPTLTGGQPISFTKDADHIKIFKGPELIGIVKNDVLLVTQFDSRLYKIPPVGISAIGPKINGVELYSVNGSRVLKRVPDITGIDVPNVSVLMGDGKHTLERHGPDIPKETIKYRAQTGIAPDGFGNSNTFTAEYASQFETPAQVNNALSKVSLGSPAYTAALSLVGATDLTMTVEYKSGVNNNPHQVFGIGYPNQLLSPPQSFVETQMTSVQSVWKRKDISSPWELVSMYPDK